MIDDYEQGRWRNDNFIILAEEEEEWEGLCNILENLILDPAS